MGPPLNPALADQPSHRPIQGYSTLAASQLSYDFNHGKTEMPIHRRHHFVIIIKRVFD